MAKNLCRCGRFWCWLDGLLGCRSRLVCDCHDYVITGRGA